MPHVEYPDDEEAKALEDFRKKLNAIPLPRRNGLLERARNLRAASLEEIEEKLITDLKLTIM